jgi:phenylacetate-CoA ligase
LSIKDRTFIRSVFQAEIFDYYSSNECGIIAWECREHSGYHIDSDNIIVELMKNGKPVPPGEEGEVVVTVLDSYAMPFIRYLLGDIAISMNERCRCGRGFPMLKMVTGRSNDCILLSNGRAVSPFLLTCAIEDIPGITKYQIIQEDLNKVKIKIVKNEEMPDVDLLTIEQSIRALLDNTVEVEVLSVEEITRDTKTNKYRTVISLLN